MKKLFSIILLIASAASLAAGSVRNDFDGDGKSDPTVGSVLVGPKYWWVLKSSGGVSVTQWGVDELNDGFVDYAAHADYDGDGKTDYAIWRLPSTAATDPMGQQAYFWILNSATGTFQAIPWGRSLHNNGVIDGPIKGDYDGDGKDDVGVFRTEGGRTFWYILQSRDGVMVEQFGLSGDGPAPGDYDGDGKNDLAIFRENVSSGRYDFYIKQSSNGTWLVKTFGFVNSDSVISGDFDGDGKSDISLWGRGSGIWSWIRSSNGQPESVRWGFGQTFDAPAPGDYDGDGKTDVAVYRVNLLVQCDVPSYFWIRGSTVSTQVVQFGSCHGHPYY